MNIEEKAKAYDEALERYKTFKEKYYTRNTNLGDVIFDRTGKMQKDFEDIFPELRESEDKRIIQKLMWLLQQDICPFPEEEVTQMLAYLEKQKKLDMMIVVSPEIWDNAISDAFENGKKEGEKQKEPNHEDEKHTDFTIYHPLKNGKGKYECIPYSFHGSLTSFSEDKDLIDFLRTCFYTKEECNEWIEQQKEQKQETISISEMVSKYRNTDEYDNDGNYKGKPVNCMIRAYEQGIRDTLSKVKEQKPAEWSEEDEKMVRFYENDYDNNLSNMPMRDVIENRIKFKDWLLNKLKSIRPQPKPAWNENDENNLNTLIQWDGIPLGLRSWVSELPEKVGTRPSWKPSEEQEQPEVDLKEEIDKMWNPRFNLGWDDNSLLSINHKSFEAIARHFYEFGLNAKEENK